MRNIGGLNVAKYLFDGNKLVWHMDRVHDHYRDGKRIYPLHIDIGATKLCNARCVYCYGMKQVMSNDIIPGDKLVKLFSDAPGLGIRSLTLTGDGEPTLNPAVYDAVHIGHQKGLDIGFATNGIKLSRTELIVLLDSCTWLRFNLSAVNSASYKAIHGVDKWECVQDNIKLAVKLKKEFGFHCTIGIQMVLIPECADQVLPEAKWAVENELDYFVIKQFSDPGCEEMSRFKLEWYDNPELIDTLQAAAEMSNAQTKIIPKFGMIKSKGKRAYDHCVDCPLIFQISGNARCYPCGYLFNSEDYCYGDLRKQSLKEILDSEKYWNVIKKMRKDFDVHKDCQGCCRHDFTNKFVWDYLNPPDHINFI
jgi:molybdenum cofactor biosynthesis enzyme MoaA